MYQYLINLEDAMIIEYLKKLTFLSKEEIEEIEKNHKEHPEAREAHKRLAEEIITDLHGKEEYEKARMMSEALFSEDITKLSLNDILASLKDIPRFTLTEDILLVDLLVNNGICSSKREAREMIGSGAISINNKKETNVEKMVTKSDLIEEKIVIVKKGKKKYYLGIYQ